jgi:hypothetical protein
MGKFIFLLSKTRKISGFLSLAAACMMLAACPDPVIPPNYRVSLPPIPQKWIETFGQPFWRLEWFDQEGRFCRFEGPEAALPAIAIPQDRSNPVLAWPYWPARGVSPGLFYPAGGIFPYDAEGGSRLRLSWEGGVDARLYLDLAAAVMAAVAIATPDMEAAVKRRPERFDWPRFRELLARGDIPEAVREDPWRADWGDIARRIAASGFDRRRIKDRDRKPLSVVVPAPGPWIPTSAFGPVQDWAAGTELILEAGENVETYFSKTGMLRYTQETWAWIPLP